MNEKPEILPLTGLRGIAAMLVVITHYQGWVAPFDFRTVPQIFWIFSTADYGMTLFFTLSGYVIAFNYLSLPWQESPLRSAAWFLWRRVTRLYPALIVFLIWAGFTNQLRVLARGHEVLWTLLHVFSIETWIPAAVGGTLPMGTVFNVSWSISTEIGMYIVFAAVLVLSARARPAITWLVVLLGLAAIVVLSFKFGEDGIAPNRLAVVEPMSPHFWSVWYFYQSPYFRLLDFIPGALAAWITLRTEPSRRLRPLAAAAAVALVALYAFRFNPETPLRIGWMGAWFGPLTAVLFATVMLNARDAGAWLNRALAWKPLVGVGTISYSLYLFHGFVPRMGLANIGSGQPFSVRVLPAYALNFFFMFGIACVLAYGMYHLLERPAMKALRAMWPSAVRSRARSDRAAELAGAGPDMKLVAQPAAE